MTLLVAIVGIGPAGLAVAQALLQAEETIQINLIDRAARPDGLLRHGPAAGAGRLKETARRMDVVLGDERVTYFGETDIGARIPLNDLRASAHAVVLATGSPRDLPLEIAGRDSVGVGTVTHIQAWLAGNADVDIDELDLAMDTAVLIGASSECLQAAKVLCGVAMTSADARAVDRLATKKLRHVQVVDARPRSELPVPEQLPVNLVVRDQLQPVGIIGRNRARAVRCVHRPDAYGRVVTEDLRAQLLLRARASGFVWSDIDEADGYIARDGARVLSAGQQVRGLYVAGWAGRGPSEPGSHAADAAAVVAALRSDVTKLIDPVVDLPAIGIEASDIRNWSATVVIDALLERFAGEGRSPLADYDALLDEVDED